MPRISRISVEVICYGSDPTPELSCSCVNQRLADDHQKTQYTIETSTALPPQQGTDMRGTARAGKQLASSSPPRRRRWPRVSEPGPTSTRGTGTVLALTYCSN